jgi:hypothetical protein
MHPEDKYLSLIGMAVGMMTGSQLCQVLADSFTAMAWDPNCHGNSWHGIRGGSGCDLSGALPEGHAKVGGDWRRDSMVVHTLNEINEFRSLLRCLERFVDGVGRVSAIDLWFPTPFPLVLPPLLLNPLFLRVGHPSSSESLSRFALSFFPHLTFARPAIDVSSPDRICRNPCFKLRSDFGRPDLFSSLKLGVSQGGGQA